MGQASSSTPRRSAAGGLTDDDTQQVTVDITINNTLPSANHGTKQYYLQPPPGQIIGPTSPLTGSSTSSTTSDYHSRASEDFLSGTDDLDFHTPNSSPMKLSQNTSGRRSGLFSAGSNVASTGLAEASTWGAMNKQSSASSSKMFQAIFQQKNAAIHRNLSNTSLGSAKNSNLRANTSAQHSSSSQLQQPILDETTRLLFTAPSNTSLTHQFPRVGGSSIATTSAAPSQHSAPLQSISTLSTSFIARAAEDLAENSASTSSSSTTAQSSKGVAAIEKITQKLLANPPWKSTSAVSPTRRQQQPTTTTISTTVPTPPATANLTDVPGRDIFDQQWPSTTVSKPTSSEDITSPVRKKRREPLIRSPPPALPAHQQKQQQAASERRTVQKMLLSYRPAAKTAATLNPTRNTVAGPLHLPPTTTQPSQGATISASQQPAPQNHAKPLSKDPQTILKVCAQRLSLIYPNQLDLTTQQIAQGLNLALDKCNPQLVTMINLTLTRLIQERQQAAATAQTPKQQPQKQQHNITIPQAFPTPVFQPLQPPVETIEAQSADALALQTLACTNPTRCLNSNKSSTEWCGCVGPSSSLGLGANEERWKSLNTTMGTGFGLSHGFCESGSGGEAGFLFGDVNSTFKFGSKGAGGSNIATRGPSPVNDEWGDREMEEEDGEAQATPQNQDQEQPHGNKKKKNKKKKKKKKGIDEVEEALLGVAKVDVDPFAALIANEARKEYSNNTSSTSPFSPPSQFAASLGSGQFNSQPTTTISDPTDPKVIFLSPKMKTSSTPAPPMLTFSPKKAASNYTFTFRTSSAKTPNIENLTTSVSQIDLDSTKPLSKCEKARQYFKFKRVQTERGEGNVLLKPENGEATGEGGKRLFEDLVYPESQVRKDTIAPAAGLGITTDTTPSPALSFAAPPPPPVVSATNVKPPLKKPRNNYGKSLQSVLKSQPTVSPQKMVVPTHPTGSSVPQTVGTVTQNPPNVTTVAAPVAAHPKVAVPLADSIQQPAKSQKDPKKENQEESKKKEEVSQQKEVLPPLDSIVKLPKSFATQRQKAFIAVSRRERQMKAAGGESGDFVCFFCEYEHLYSSRAFKKSLGHRRLKKKTQEVGGEVGGAGAEGGGDEDNVLLCV
ncbi:hypothetical protein HDV05_001638 [Chytridiales sp. JEL 0842]|nr:hypothetical protein HDV05_001638 [Chytridiales sp. JEL 0842]